MKTAKVLSIINDLFSVCHAPNGISYRPIIVWAMNDKLEKAVLSKQLRSFKQVGYGGVMVMPWGGLPYEFMSDQWIEMVRHILEEARKIDIDIWIWDDWLFGSGPAGGELTNNQKYRAKTLKIVFDFVIEPGESAEFIVPPRALCGTIFNINKYGNPIGEKYETLDLSSHISIKGKTDTRKRIMVVGWEYRSGMQHTTQSHGDFLDPNINENECDICVHSDLNVWSVDMMKPQAIAQYVKLIHEKYWEAVPEFFGNTLKGFFYDEPKALSMPWTEDFADRFQKIKGYDLTGYLPSIMVDYTQDGGNFNDKSRPETIKKVLADYRDVWTTLHAETFYGTIQSWCKEHNVIATGHPIGDNSLKEVFSNGGFFFKNMAFSDMPGVDVVGSWVDIVPGKFVDSPRFAGSCAALLGKPRAMSESFAVYGHGLHIDQMRYICEHQIMRRVNTFFFKLSNYNREKSLHFHPPELSEFNPIMEHFGSRLCERIHNIAMLMNSGTLCQPRIGLYVGMSNYYYGDANIADQTEAIAEKLVYNQIEFDYIWDKDVLGMGIGNNNIKASSGAEYSYLMIPSNIIMYPEVSNKIGDLEKNGVVCKLPDKKIDEIISLCRSVKSQIIKSISADIKISMQTRMLEDGVQCSMMLNESKNTECLRICVKETAKIFEIDLNTGKIELIKAANEGTEFDLEFVPYESRILICDSANKFISSKKDDDTFEEVILSKWTLETSDGKKIDIGRSFPDWQQLGLGGYTGMIRYRSEFDWNETSKSAILALGELCYAAIVYLDGNRVGDCPFTPFNLKLTGLSKGRHLLEIDVLNTMANQIFGDPEKLKKLRSDKVFKGTYAILYEKLDLAKIRSGLFGPVKMIYPKTMSTRNISG